MQLGWSVIEHPFWTRWAAGELSDGELALFAGEYDHVATAIATAASRAAALDPRLAELAEREGRHLACWRRFARALGWGGMAAWIYAAEALPETEECARLLAGDGDRTAEEHLLVLRDVGAVEAAVGEVMLNGLLRHYRFQEGEATEYFSLHVALDEGSADGRDGEVELAYRKMLDGVEALGVRARS